MDGINFNEGMITELDELLSKNKPEGKAYEPVKKLLESGKVQEIYSAANRPEATAEDKAKWANYTYKLHTGLNAFLADIKKNNPAKFEQDDVIANINNAYALNTYVCADALSKSGVSVIQTCINEAYDKANSFGKYEDFKNDPEKVKEFENALAKTLYLARLKYEYENVHGNPEEQKAWRGEILTELMSDSLDGNALKYKDSEVYKLVMNTVRWHSDFRLGWKKDHPDSADNEAKFSLNDDIQSAFRTTGEKLYHGIYHHFGTEVKTEEDKKEVLDTVAKLDEFKAIATATGWDRTGKKNLRDVTFNPCFDTLHIKKRAKLYGVQKDFISDNRKKEQYDADVNRFVQNYKEADEKRWKEGGKEKKLQEARKKLSVLNGILKVDESIAAAEKEYTEHLDKEKSIENEIARISLEVQAANIKIKALNEEIKKTKKKAEKEDKKFAVKRYEGSVEQLELQIKDLKAQKKELNEQGELIREKKYAQLSVKSAGLEEAYGKGYPENVDYRADIKKLKDEIKELREEKEGLKQDYVKRAKNFMLTYRRDEHFVIADEENEYKKIGADTFGIEEKRDEREKEFKKDHIELYNVTYPVIGTDKNGNELYDFSKPYYSSKPTEEAVASLRDAFANYKIKNKINDDATDTAFENSLNKYKELEQKYTEGTKIEKPVRNNLPINVYKASAVAGLNIGDIPVREENVKRFIEPALAPVPVNAVNPADKVTMAVNLVNAKAQMGIFGRKGSAEYQDIFADLKKLQQKMNTEHSSEYEKQIMIPAFRKLLIQMDDYIQRKEDEKPAREKTSSNAFLRRTNMIQARAMLKEGMNSLMIKNRVTDHDYAYDDVKFSIENTRKLTKESNPAVERLYGMISSKDKDCIQNMYNYIIGARRQYSKKTDNGRDYDFKLRENDPSRKKNLPKDSDERYYRNILLGFEKIVKADLDNIVKNNPEKLEAAKFKYGYKDNDPKKPESIDTHLGLDIKPDDFNASLDIEKKDSLEEYKKMFDNHYKVLLSQLQFGSFKEKVSNPDEYDIREILPAEKKYYLIESVLSSVFAKYLLKQEEQAREKNPNYVSRFDFNNTEEERVRFVSLMKSTGLFDKMYEYTMKINDLKMLEGDKDQIYEYSAKGKNIIATPEKFAESILVSAVSDDFAKHYEKIRKNLSAGKDFDVQTAKKDLNWIDMDLQVIKAAGQTEKFDKIANDAITNGKLKGKNLKESVEGIKNEFKNKTERKVVAPAKGVSM